MKANRKALQHIAFIALFAGVFCRLVARSPLCIVPLNRNSSASGAAIATLMKVSVGELCIESYIDFRYSGISNIFVMGSIAIPKQNVPTANKINSEILPGSPLNLPKSGSFTLTYFPEPFRRLNLPINTTKASAGMMLRMYVNVRHPNRFTENAEDRNTKTGAITIELRKKTATVIQQNFRSDKKYFESFNTVWESF